MKKIAGFALVNLIFIVMVVCLAFAGCTGKKSKDYGALALDQEEIAPLPDLPSDDGIPLTKDEKIAMSYHSDFIKRLSDKDETEVQLHFKYFTRKARERFERYLLRAERYMPYAQKVFQGRNIPLDVVFLAIVESGYNPNAVSTAGATGMWQFMPGTGDLYGLKRNWWIDERRDPYESTEAAATYLLKLYGDFGDWYLALAAYNAGEGKISRAMDGTGAEDFFELCNRNEMLGGKDKLRDETRKYVPKFIAVARIMHNLKRLGFQELNPAKWQEPAHLELEGGTDLKGLASSAGMSWEEFVEYNPAPQRQATAPGSTVRVHLPQNRLADAKAYLATPESHSFAGWKQYKIRKGDTLAKIGKRTGVPGSVILQANQISPHSLKPGKTILVPGNLERNTETAYGTSAGNRMVKGGSYTVGSGETLYSIAKACNISVESLREANGLHKNAHIKPGQKIYLPAGAKSLKGKHSSSSKKGAKSAKNKDDEDNTPVIEKPSNSSKGGKNSKTPGSAKKGDDSSKADTIGASHAASHAESGKSSHKVQKGDTIYSIARRYGVQPSDIMKWNGLSKAAVLKPGASIKVAK